MRPLQGLFTAFLVSCQLLQAGPARADTPDWSRDARIPKEGRPNPYHWNDALLKEKTRAGRLHALEYPIEVTGLLVPARPALFALNSKPGDPLFGILRSILSLSSDFQDFRGFWSWLGLHDYPETEGEIPFPNHRRPAYPMGVSIVKKNGAEGFTLSCAACHSASLFGKPVLGLTNRFPRANLFFIHGQKALEMLNPELFALVTDATRAEKKMYAGSREKISSVGLKRPETLGLDTSLAQVALSLAKRAQTPWAERDPEAARNPRPNPLETEVADSKPAPWWNVKYKTRWLSDGSVVSGNPIFTNFLWNEIGRGADLPELVDWLKNRSSLVEELTTAVFATKAPKWSEFLPETWINVARAKKGETLFNQNCAKCHGSYEKAWSAKIRTESETDTIRVTYFETTKTKDVGTDPGRRMGMKYLAEALNPLAFSREFGILIEEQAGYIPPPLEGIWARFPYLHNNSVPSLCALLTPPELRPVTYLSRELKDPGRDFDPDCVGYPSSSGAEEFVWKDESDRNEHVFDTRKTGLSNQGHYGRIMRNEDGSERYTPDQKKDLIEFLKTL